LDPDGEREEIGTSDVKEYVDFDISPGNQYYYWVVAKNIAGTSDYSAVAGGHLGIPPGSVIDLSISSSGIDSLSIAWTAPGGPESSSGPLQSYDIRYSTWPITYANWDNAEQATGVPSPQAPGTQEAFVVGSLIPSTKYWVALRSKDGTGLVSGISNVASSTTSAVLAASPASLELALGTGEGTVRTITLNNLSSTLTLEYEVRIESAGATTAQNEASALKSSTVQSAKRLQGQIPAAMGEWIVRIKPDSPSDPGALLKGNSVNTELSDQARKSIRSVGESLRGTLKAEIRRSGIQLWDFNADSSAQMEEVVKQLLSDPLIEYVEPNYPLYALGVPNDERFDELWGLRNQGQSTGTPDADIDADDAWEIETGSTEVVVAVIDTGVDYNHPDLRNNMWINSGEVPENGLDDDGNGYVDDVYGYDFANNDGDPFDDNRHGTHCAGTIGAEANNGIGVAGVSQRVSVMPVKFLGGGGRGSTYGAVQSIHYAVDNGAVILSNSWGGGGASQALEDAISYANDRGVLFVAAAGNKYSNNDIFPNFPSNYDIPNVLAVAATDRSDEKARFSSYGKETVHLGAPGVEILSSTPEGQYGFLSGTSMATPHVAGAAALLKAYNPEISGQEMKALLIDSVDRIDSMAATTISGGRLNVFRALQNATPQWVMISSPASGSIAPAQGAEIELLIDSTGLSSEVYHAKLVVRLSEPYRIDIEVPIDLSMGIPSSSAASAVLLAPEGLVTQSAIYSDRVRISWDQVEGATGYRIQRSETLGGDYFDIGTTTELTFDDPSSDPDTLYYYRVSAIYGDEVSHYSSGLAATRTERSADISIETLSASGAVGLGDDISYSLSYANAGPDELSDAGLWYALPPNVDLVSARVGMSVCDQEDEIVRCSAGALASGTSVVVDIVIRPQEGGSVISKILVAPSQEEPVDLDPANNEVTIITTVAPRADLSVHLVEIEVGDSAESEVVTTVSNHGPSDASDVIVEFQFSEVAGLVATPDRGACMELPDKIQCDLGDLRSGIASMSIIAVDGTVPGVLSVAVVSSDDGNSGNDFASLAIPVPEPTVEVGLLAGLLTLAALTRRRRRVLAEG